MKKMVREKENADRKTMKREKIPIIKIKIKEK
jgi:hypothetical protein